jgi:hypothetical protein
LAVEWLGQVKRVDFCRPAVVVVVRLNNPQVAACVFGEEQVIVVEVTSGLSLGWS